MNVIEPDTAKKICELALAYGMATKKAEEVFHDQTQGRATADERRKAEAETREAYAALVELVYDLVPPAAFDREREASSD